MYLVQPAARSQDERMCQVTAECRANVRQACAATHLAF
jgi:hypothetical protein